MKIKKLYGENIYSFRKLTVDFLDFAGVISIILGKNLDQKTANGAGKTSILKALYWGLWNKDLNGATIDEMINRMYPDDGMLTIIEFEDRGYEYKITRYKDYKPKVGGPKLHDGNPISGSGVEFLVNGNPLMGDTHPKTQLIIEQKLRMSPRLFLSCVLMAQNTRLNFLTANDTEKKELLSELLDLQAYDKAFKAIKEAIKEVEDRISNNENKIENLNEQIQNNEEQIVKLTTDEDNYVQDTQMKLTKMDMESQALSEAIKKVKQLADSEDKAPTVRAQISGIDSQIKKLKEDLTQEGQIIGALKMLEAEINQKNTAISELEQTIKEKEQTLIDLKTKSVNVTEQDFVTPQQNLTVKITALKTNLSSLETNQISLEQGYLASQKSLTSKITQTKNEISETQRHLKEAEDNALCPTCLRLFEAGDDRRDKVVKVYTDKIHALMEELQTKETELLDIKQKLEDLSSVNGQMRNQREELVQLETQLQELKNQDQAYQLSKKDKLLWEGQIVATTEEITKLQANVANHQKTVKVNTKKQLEVQELFDALQPLKTKLLDLETSISEQREELLKLEGLSVQISGAKREVNEKTTQLNALKKEREELATKANPYTNMKNNLLKMVETFKERLAKHKQTAVDSQEELKYLNFWRTGFSPIGIRSFITDDVIELLNRKTQENLNDLFDGAISVLFDPESKNSKGIMSNKISTTFLHNGKETSVNLLSGGELQRAILATELALTEVAEARAGTKLNLRFLDEPFTGMDNNGQIKSLGLFARMARDKDGFFVISHDENFQHLCQKALFVVKQKEISYLVDKDAFNKAEIEAADMSSGYEEGENLQLVNPPKPKKGGIDISKALAKKKKQVEEDDE